MFHFLSKMLTKIKKMKQKSKTLYFIQNYFLKIQKRKKPQNYHLVSPKYQLYFL